jgi:hypothetical protein
MNRNDRVMQAQGCAPPPQGEAVPFSEASLRPPSELWAKTTLFAQSSAGPGRVRRMRRTGGHGRTPRSFAQSRDCAAQSPDPAPQRGGPDGEA